MARYGRRPKSKEECQVLWNPPARCQEPPNQTVGLEDEVSDGICNQRIWVRYEISNRTADWGSSPPFFIQRSAKYSLVWDDETNQVLYSTSVGQCQQNKTICENWRIPQQLFCAEPVTAALLVWFGIFLLPTFLLNLTILITTFRTSFIVTVFRYPQLIFQGLFGTFLFGPLDHISLQWGCKKLKLSESLTLVNFVLTLGQLALGLFVLSQNYPWGFLFQTGKFMSGPI